MPTLEAHAVRGAATVFAACLIMSTALPSAFAQRRVHAALATPPDAMRRRVIEEALADMGTGVPPRVGHSAPETDPEHVHRDPVVVVGDALSVVAYRFLYGITPAANGVERPNPDERMLDDLEVPLGDTPLSYVLQGVGNYRYLTRTYYYTQFDGVHSLRLNLVAESDPSPFRFSVTASPLHGSINVVSRHMGVEADEDLPDQLIYGGAGGLEASYGSGPMRVRARTYLLPEVDLGWTGSTGVAQFQSIDVVIDLNAAVGWPTDEPLEVSVALLHTDRGEARRPLYDYGDGTTRGVLQIREIWQAMTHLTIRYD